MRNAVPTLVLVAAALLLTAPRGLAQATPTVAQLVAVLDDPDKSEQSKQEAVRALGALGAKAEPALPALEKLLKAGDRTMASEVVRALGKVGKSAVPHLVSVAADDKADDGMRGQAFTALAGMGKDAAAAAPALVKLIDLPSPLTQEHFTKSPFITNSAIQTLAKVADPKDAAAAVAAVLTNPPVGNVGGKLAPHPYWRQVAGVSVRCLAPLGPDAKAAAPALVALLKLESERDLFSSGELLAVTAALAAIGPDAADALPYLRAMLTAPKTKSSGKQIEQAIEAIKAKKP